MLKFRLLFSALVAFATSYAAAADGLGRWVVGQGTAGNAYMIVFNDSDNAFGKFCDMEESACFWMLLTRTSCNAGTSGTMLINNGLGAEAVQSHCSTPIVYAGKTYYRYIVGAADRMDELILDRPEVGFAMALEGGAFRVTRFVTDKARSAHFKWLELVDQAVNQRPASTKDYVL